MGNSLRRVLRECLTAAMVEREEEGRAEECMRVGHTGSESKKSSI
jgi:hypothetical protein